MTAVLVLPEWRIIHQHSEYFAQILNSSPVPVVFNSHRSFSKNCLKKAQPQTDSQYASNKEAYRRD